MAKQNKKTEPEQDAFGDDVKPRAQRPDRPQGETLVSGATYWDFEQNPVFTGQYLREFLRPKDGDLSKKEKKGDVIGFVMVHDETGEEVIISNSFQVKEALDKIGRATDVKLWIEFEGKITQKKTGKPLNRFHIMKIK